MTSDEQAVELAALERDHGRIVSLDAGTPLGNTVLYGEPDGSHAYFCAHCGEFYVIETDGATSTYQFMALHEVTAEPLEDEPS